MLVLWLLWTVCGPSVLWSRSCAASMRPRPHFSQYGDSNTRHSPPRRAAVHTARVMQSANAAAPKILEALRILGNAEKDHVRFAMLGLSPDLQAMALDACTKARPVAWRLRSREIATTLRIETADMRRRYSDLVTTKADWSSPVGILGGEIVQVLITSMIGYERTDRHVQDYRAAAKLAGINREWRDAVRMWRDEECSIFLDAAYDATPMRLFSIPRVAPNVRALYCHPLSHSGGPKWSIDKEAVLALRACTKLERLMLDNCEGLDSSTLIALLQSCPSLHKLRLVCSEVSSPTYLCIALPKFPHVVVTVSRCSSLLSKATDLSRHLNVEACQWCATSARGNLAVSL